MTTVTFGRTARAALLALSTLGALSAPAAAFDVASCETTVPARETAVLRADLDCTVWASTIPPCSSGRAPHSG